MGRAMTQTAAINASNARAASARAFTLLELVVVASILAVLAAIAAPRFGDATARARLDAAASRIESEVDSAVARARASTTPLTIRARIVGDALVISEQGAPVGDELAVIALAEAPYRADILAVDPLVTSSLDISAWGELSGGMTIRLGVGRLRRDVTLGAGGAVSAAVVVGGGGG